MKFLIWTGRDYPIRVASRVGAWIEITHSSVAVMFVGVASRVGAWIEIDCGWYELTRQLVASRVGAWIEILRYAG